MTYTSFATRLLAVAILLLACVPSSDVHAQVRANTQKLFINLHALGARAGLDLSGFTPEDVRGGGVKLGYGFSKVVTLYAGLNAAVHESANAPGSSVGQGFADLGLQIHLTSGRSAFVPYLDVAATGQAAMLATADGDITLSGYGGSLGGGVKFFLTPTVALDANARVTRGLYTAVEVNGLRADLGEVFGVPDVGSSAVGLSLGLTFNPLR